MRREFLQRGDDSGAATRKLRQKVSAGIFGNIDFPIANGATISVLCLAESRSPIVKHRNIDYGVEEDRPGLWRWIIYPKIEVGPKVIGEAKYSTREAAVSAWIEEINNGLERARSIWPPSISVLGS